MAELFWKGPTFELVSVSLLDIALTGDIHAYFSGKGIRETLIDRLGFNLVSEADVDVLRKHTFGDETFWHEGMAVRFFMDPIIREERGEVVTYTGPYRGIGDHGYEVGLYRQRPREDFPIKFCAPVQCEYPALTTLIVKT